MIAISSLRLGLRYNGKVIAPGAQTESPEDAGPVKTLLAGEVSPADFVSDQLSIFQSRFNKGRIFDLRKTSYFLLLMPSSSAVSVRKDFNTTFVG
jgi:hypothetical protein